MRITLAERWVFGLFVPAVFVSEDVFVLAGTVDDQFGELRRNDGEQNLN